MDLLCSRNARPQKALVGRAQWKLNQPPSLERKRASLEGAFISLDVRSQGQPRHFPKESIGENLTGCHSDVKTTMMYIHALKRGSAGVVVR